MKKTFLKLAGALAVAAGLLSAPAASAATIKGAVTFAGGATLNGGLTTATGITAFQGTSVLVGTGSYTGTDGTAATFTPFNWSPASTPVSPLWTFTIGGTTYSFDLTTLVVDGQSASGIVLEGQGIAKITGFEDTPGFFYLSLQPPNLGGNRFTFSSGVDVPEGGSAIALLGLALLGVEGARRRMKAVKA